MTSVENNPRISTSPQAQADGAEEPLTNKLINAVAIATDTSIEDLPPLSSSIDPDALLTIFNGRYSPQQITFTYADTHVTIDSDHTITVET